MKFSLYKNLYYFNKLELGETNVYVNKSTNKSNKSLNEFSLMFSALSNPY